MLTAGLFPAPGGVPTALLGVPMTPCAPLRGWGAARGGMASGTRRRGRGPAASRPGGRRGRRAAQRLGANRWLQATRFFGIH